MKSTQLLGRFVAEIDIAMTKFKSNRNNVKWNKKASSTFFTHEYFKIITIMK